MSAERYSPSSAGRRPRSDGEQTKKAILAAATKEFSARGFHGARVDGIARRAGVNKERLYANFGNKEGLFNATLRECFLEIAEEERELLALAPEECAAFPEKVLRRYFEIHRCRPWLWRLLAWENLDGGRHSSALEGLKRPLLEHLQSLYTEGQRRGVFPGDVSFETLLFILTAVSAFYHSNERTLSKSIGLDASSPDALERLITETLTLVSRK